MKSIYILADKTKQGDYYGSEIVDKGLERYMESFEYGDIAEHEVQIWEYPAGKIYDVVPDRKVSNADYYTTPYTSRGTMWLPKLVEIATDKNRVAEAYERLMNPPKRDGVLRRLGRRLRRR